MPTTQPTNKPFEVDSPLGPDGVHPTKVEPAPSAKLEEVVEGNELPTNDDEAQDQGGGQDASDRGPRFWLIMAGLIMAALISALDGSVVSTALPSIVHEFSLGPDYVWVIDIYFLTTAAFQPLFGQLSDLWGRRWIFIATVALFVLGSGLIGGATSGEMLIAARGVQGVGAGGINMLVDLIVCDLVPLRDRGTYMGLIFGVAVTASALGPLIAGALTDAGAWRWIFYMNIPLGGVCIAITVAWLRVSHRKEGTFSQRLRRVDWIGTLLIIASTVSVLWALAYGGSTKSWSDGSIVAALVCGLVGLGLFFVWQAAPQCKYPLAPPHLFRHRTSQVAFFLTFTNAIMIFWVVFIYPVYFQAVLSAKPKQSGIWLLPFVLVFPFAAAISGNLMAKFGRYKPLHVVGFALCIIGCGMSSILTDKSHKALWVVFQILLAIGIAVPISCLLPAVQAPLADTDTATSTGTWAFIRSFGSIFGVSIPAAIFNDRFAQLLYTVDDPAARAALSGGKAYEEASASLSSQFTGEVHSQVIHVYNMGLKRVWQIGIVFSAVSLVVALLEKEVPMRKDLNTDFGLEKSKQTSETTVVA